MGSTLEEYQQFRLSLEKEVQNIEKVISDMEWQYLQAEYSQPGSVLKGFEGFLSSKDTLRKRSRTYKIEDRLFSLSSKSSPVTRELEQSILENIDGLASGGFGKKGYSQKGYAHKGYAQKGKR